MTNQRKTTIRKRILITFVLLIVIPVVILSGLNIAGILVLSRDNAADSSEALRVEELNNLQVMANDTTLFIKESFQKVSDEVSILAEYGSDLFNDRINATPRPYYYWDATEYPSVPGLGYDAKYDMDVSFEVSCYYIPPDSMNGTFDNLDAAATTVLEISSNLDTAFKMLHEANEDYIWYSAGFEVGGLYKNYPYNNLDFFYYDDPPYDPRDRPWYIDSIGVEDIVFTSPYLDPTSGLMISAGREIRFDNDTLIGVISLDLTIDTIKIAVEGLDVSDNGYAFLIDDAGKAIAHPAIPDPIPGDYEAEDVADMVFDSSDTSSKTAFNTAVDLMLAGEYGQTTFYKNDGKDKWYIVFAPIEITGYSFGILVPESDLIAPANAVRAQINKLSIGETFAFAAVLALIIVVIVLFASLISKRIVEPIKELTTMVEFITQGDLSREMKTESASYSKEIGILHSAFQNLVTTLRFGNTDYYRGDLNRAYDNYTKALELFKTTNNQRGIGICYNNLGNIYRAWGEFDRALESYLKAIEIGEDMGDKAGLASRYNNLGLFYLEKGQMTDALECLEKALAFDEELDNTPGITIRLGNLGLYYSKKGDTKEAKRYYQKAIKVCEQHEDRRSLAHALLNMGSFLADEGDDKQARQQLEKALDTAKAIEDVRVVVTCYEKLAEVYERLNLASKGHQAQSKATELRRSMVSKKYVLFVIDYSGSMQGARIRAAVAGAKKILDSQINPQDDVAIIIFNEGSQVLLPLTNMGRNRGKVMQRIDRLRYPQYRTSFYDALGDAVDQLHTVKTNDQKWIIALTDGLDNTSTRFTITETTSRRRIGGRKSAVKSVQGYIKETMLNANLIIVGVGDELRAVEAPLKQLCAETPRGKYIGISSTSKVAKAIDEAFHEVKDLLAQVDIEGFDVDDY